MQLKKFNNEVLFTKDEIVKTAHKEIAFLKGMAKRNPRNRIRLCAHRDINDVLHEMIIVHKKGNYIRPHKHLNKSESFHIIEGKADVFLFDEEGNIIEIIRMGDYNSGLNFYYRISGPYYHTLLIKSNFAVFHEVTNGPFRKNDNIFAPWAPAENDNLAIKEFMKRLKKD